MTQKMIRVRIRVSAISRRHPIAGFRVTRSGSGWSQVRQYRSLAGINPTAGERARLALGLTHRRAAAAYGLRDRAGFGVAFGDAFGDALGEALGATGLGLASSGWLSV